ncbi:hypothetical protein [Haloarcula salinisoli]|uniref:Uncharacterized protein n=1 Tax=Haloarcula salinisoli TaxID=2487746 RepID=A0A8J7YGZ7_9EURY|nr:hypothetical protein [Halomicroarcula salinisoli]MBX0305347.1 hypothetical protein [Halomicroarcula salinisoli]
MVLGDGISKQKLLLAVGITVVAIAGVLLLTGGSDSAGAINQVPAGVDTLVRVDLAITSDRLTQFEVVVSGVPLGGADNATAAFGNETGIDPGPAREVVVFSDNRSANESAYHGFVLHTNAEIDTAVEGIQDTTNSSYQSTTYNGQTVYAPANASNRYIGVLGEGQLVVGTQAAVRDTIDVNAGDADTVEGPLRQTYENTDNGTVRFATTAPERWVPGDSGGFLNTEAYRKLDTASGTYYIEGGDAGLTVRLGASSGANAQTVEQATKGAAVIGQQTIENESVAAALDSVNVTREDKTVTVRYEQPLGAFQRTVRYLYGEF